MPKFLLTIAQAKKLHDAIKNNKKCTLTLSTSKQSPNGVEIPLSARQISLLADGRPHKITLYDKNGGFLPLLGLLAPIIASAVSAGKSIYDIVKGKGVGEATIPASLMPAISNMVLNRMQKNGKGISDTLKEIFLNKNFVSLICDTIKNKVGTGLILGKNCGSGLKLGPPCARGIKLGTYRGRGSKLGPPKML